MLNRHKFLILLVLGSLGTPACGVRIRTKEKSKESTKQRPRDDNQSPGGAPPQGEPSGSVGPFDPRANGTINLEGFCDNRATTASLRLMPSLKFALEEDGDDFSNETGTLKVQADVMKFYTGDDPFKREFMDCSATTRATELGPNVPTLECIFADDARFSFFTGCQQIYFQ